MRTLASILILGAGLMLPAFGQQAQEEDGPGRGVARLSVLNGDVSIRRGDSGDFVAAALNGPLVVGDRVLTGPSSRGEVQFDSSNMIRIGANSEVRLSELEYRRYQIQVALGTTTFRVLRNQMAQVELSTPSVAIRPLRDGVYRISVHEDGTSEITVRAGEADISTPRGSERIGAGRTMIARGAVDNPEFQMVATLGVDGWDQWNDARDRDLLRSQSYNYVGQDINGVEDLDANGTWVDVPTYGRVWRPVVTADWAPYRNGRWVWMDYYGWTWVSYDSWGWAPYHYGRWMYEARFGWCWWPGGPGRTYWRPALVAFFGWGHGGVGFGFGNVGWVPLAPYEPFHPWYGRGYYGGYRGGTTIVQNTTIINNTNITNVYRNARVSNGITGMPSDRFGRGAVGSSNYTRVSANDVERAGLMRGQLPMTPGRESLRMADRPVQTHNLPRTSDNRQFYSTRQPSRVDRVPFEQQRQSVEQSARRTFGGNDRSGEMGNVRNSAPLANGRSFENSAPASQAPAGGNDRGGWRRMGEGGTQSQSAPPVRSQGPSAQPSSGGESNGASWHRFGEPGQHNSSIAQPRNENGWSRQDSQPRGGSMTMRNENPQDTGNSRSFGSSGRGMDNYQSQQPANPGRSSQDSRGFGSSGRGMDNYPSQPRYSAPEPAYRAPAPQRDRGSFDGGRLSAPVRINPPIVRERSSPPSPAPRGDSGGGNHGGGNNGGGGDRGGGRRGR